MAGDSAALYATTPARRRPVPPSPLGAETVPVLMTALRAIRNTSPPLELILPRLMTLASESPESVSAPLLCMKASLQTSTVDATKRPPVVTMPDGPTTMPCGLITYRPPMAPSRPVMADGEPPVTRFSVAPEPLSNVTLLFWPTEKLFQLITPCVEPGCVITRPFPWVAMVPAPAT